MALLFAAPAASWAQKGKPVVAIYQMEDLTNSGQAPTFSAMIETAIASTSKFRVIERERLNRLIGEQARAKSGLVTSNTPGKLGGFEGADFLIYGTITTISVTKKTDIGSSLIGGMLSGSSGKNTYCANTYATLGADIKITDANSGEVKYVTRIAETQKSAATCDNSTQVDTARLLRAAADRIAVGLVTTIYPIQIASVQPDGTIILNYGEGALQPAAILGVYAKGEIIRDPATGEIIANNETKLGYIQVTEVMGRVSKASAISTFQTSPPIGSIVRLATTADVQALAKAQKKKSRT